MLVPPRSLAAPDAGSGATAAPPDPASARHTAHLGPGAVARVVVGSAGPGPVPALGEGTAGPPPEPAVAGPTPDLAGGTAAPAAEASLGPVAEPRPVAAGAPFLVAQAEDPAAVAAHRDLVRRALVGEPVPGGGASGVTFGPLPNVPARRRRPSPQGPLPNLPLPRARVAAS